MSRIREFDSNGNLVRDEEFPDPPEVANAATLDDRVAQALAANASYLALAAPTSAQVASQVRLLTRECSALIRLLTRRLDAAD